ncbi:MAG: hypothetical protein GX786_04320 [Clostridiales bacterium]|nr:hypothetical protein [Clostridiales bacterium]
MFKWLKKLLGIKPPSQVHVNTRNETLVPEELIKYLDVVGKAVADWSGTKIIGARNV